MTQASVEPKQPHYRMTLEAAKQAYKQGLVTATGLLQFVIDITKPPLPIQDIQGFCKQYGISKSAFYKAVRRLQELGHYPLTEQNSIEREVRDRLQLKLGGLIEVSTPAGRIDLLTDNEIIEVKHVNDWKSAMGQILAYSGFYPLHSKRIHLFGERREIPTATAITICSELDITLTFEKVQ